MHSEETMSRLRTSGCYAVKVRSRAEIAVSVALREKGFEVFLPTYTDTRSYSDRIRKVSCAVFPGYAFVRMSPEEHSRVALTKGVNYVVKAGTSLQPIPVAEESTLRTLCTLDGGYEPHENFAIGERVRIETGPFRGQEGVLVRRAGKDRVVLSLNSIFSAVSIDLRDTVITTCKYISEHDTSLVHFSNQSAA